MSMTLRAVATAAAVPTRVLRRLFSTGFIPPINSAAPSARVEAEPSTNLFVSARVVTDRVSGYSKGFGFVKYATLDDAAKGKEGLDGKFLEGWVIFAEYARPRQPPPTHGNYMAPPYNRY